MKTPLLTSTESVEQEHIVDDKRISVTEGNPDVMKRPLMFYDNGMRTLSEMVWEKWRDANQQILCEYGRKTWNVIDKRKILKHSAHSQEKPDQIGILAHHYLQRKEAQSEDFVKQSRLAALYDRRLDHSMPRLKKAGQIIRNIFLISGIATSVLMVGRGKSCAIQGSVAISCLSIAAAFCVLVEQRNIHHRAIRIKSYLLSWHKMTENDKNAFYEDIMKPAHMGLCGFIETFYRTNTI